LAGVGGATWSRGEEVADESLAGGRRVVADEADRFTRACIIIAHNTAGELTPGRQQKISGRLALLVDACACM
jgi:hypothetical protein